MVTKRNNGRNSDFLTVFVPGFTAAAIAEVTTLPLDTLKVRQQLRQDKVERPSEALRSIYRTRGIPGFYGGTFRSPFFLYLSLSIHLSIYLSIYLSISISFLCSSFLSFSCVDDFAFSGLPLLSCCVQPLLFLPPFSPAPPHTHHLSLSLFSRSLSYLSLFRCWRWHSPGRLYVCGPPNCL